MGIFDKLKRIFGVESSEEAARRAQEGIDAFWSFWTAREAELFEEVDDGVSPATIEEISAAVHRIHPELEWEFGPGVKAPHGFTVSGTGDATLRTLAERWRAAAPPSDAFDFFVARQQVPQDQLMGTSLGLDGIELDFAQVQVRLTRNENRRAVDVLVYHPSFQNLDEEGRLQASFIILDKALGEDAVERWIGSIDVLNEAPDDGVDLPALLDEANAMVQLPEDCWCVAEGQERGRPLVYVVNMAIKRWDYPLFDTWCQIRLDYDGDDGGMPSEEDKTTLDEIEEGLLALLGEDAVHIGRRTGNNHRLLFLYVDGAADTAERILAWSHDCGRPARLTVEEDPGWQHRL